MTEIDSVRELIGLLERLEKPDRGIQYQGYALHRQKSPELVVEGLTAEELYSMISNARSLIDELRGLRDEKTKVLYRTTVHLLLDLGNPDYDDEAAGGDAVGEILRDHMQKYSAPESCLVDWCFAKDGSLEQVDVPIDYEPDEDPFPLP